MVSQLVHGQKQKVAVLHIGHRSKSSQGRADGNSSEPRLGDGSVENPLGAELLAQTQRYSESPAEPALNPNVFAQQDDSLIPAHLLLQGFPQRLDDRELSSFHFSLNQVIRRRHRSNTPPQGDWDWILQTPRRHSALLRPKPGNQRSPARSEARKTARRFRSERWDRASSTQPLLLLSGNAQDRCANVRQSGRSLIRAGLAPALSVPGRPLPALLDRLRKHRCRPQSFLECHKQKPGH